MTTRRAGGAVLRRRGVAMHPAVALGLASTALFLLTAVVGVVVAADRVAALEKFLLLVIGLELALCLGLAGDRPSFPRRFLGMVVALTAVSLLVAWLERDRHGGEALAEAMLALLPLLAGALLLARNEAWWRGVIAAGAAMAVCVAVLLYLRERTIWLALATGIFAVGLVELWLRRSATPAVRRLVCTLGIGACVLLALYVVEMLDPRALQTDMAQLPGALASRFTLWHDALPIIADYRFSGSGLGNAAMVFSTYLFLVHVPYVHHVHNLYLQIAMEQGVPAVVALLGMFGSALWALRRPWRSSRDLHLLAAAVFVALVSLLAGGLLDAELYAGRLVFLLFVPMGSAWALHRRAAVSAAVTPVRRPLPRLALVAGLPYVAAACLVLWPAGLPNLLLNIGAVRQTQVELRAYHWPDTDVQDRVRRRQQAELLPAVAAYRQVLALDPDNVAANRRLAQIALSQGAYATAAAHLSTAYAQDPDAWVVCRLWGESLALTGSPARAAAVWQDAAVPTTLLDLRLHWYATLDDATGYGWMEEAVARARMGAPPGAQSD
ncbi:MAG: O-antigen ligase family protein [Caldilineaceae bacterium]|nr:O-antigen ligase family protein [Caldilineaceae bacterium]